MHIHNYMNICICRQPLNPEAPHRSVLHMYGANSASKVSAPVSVCARRITSSNARPRAFQRLQFVEGLGFSVWGGGQGIRAQL